MKTVISMYFSRAEFRWERGLRGGIKKPDYRNTPWACIWKCAGDGPTK